MPLLLALCLTLATPLVIASERPVPVAAVDRIAEAPADEAPADNDLYLALGLEGILDRTVFLAGQERMEQHGIQARVLAIADLTQPSTAQRLFIIDLDSRSVVLQSWVAHGQGSGGLMAERFSNVEGSHQTSLGLYRVGQEIVSPKHGPALLLEGLDLGTNDQARAREIIVHGADYVSERFIADNGRLGRSWGCPAVPRDQMASVIELLADGGLLYVHGD